MVVPNSDAFFIEDICAYLQNVLATYWNAERTEMNSEWGAEPYPKTVESANVQWGPEIVPMRDPMIYVYSGSLLEAQHTLGRYWRGRWEINIDVSFHVTSSVLDINKLTSRYAVVTYRTIRQHYNWDNSGSIQEVTLEGIRQLAIVNQETQQVEEAASSLTLHVWGYHSNHTP